MKAGIDKAKRWFVIRTNIKCEDRAASSLRSAGYDVYLPKMRKDIIHHRTKCFITKEFVLFNRYLFVGIGNGDFYSARGCDGVECFLGIDGAPVSVSAGDVEAIYLAEFDMAFDDTRAAQIHRGDILASEKAQFAAMFPKGRNIRVKESHAFSGFYGQVVKAKGKSKVKAMLKMFGGLVPVEFDGADLEPLDVTDEAA